MKELRPYQELNSFEIRQALAKYRKVLFRSETGSGKTRIATDVIERDVNKKIKCIFLTDRVRILKQAIDTFRSHGIKCESFEKETNYLWITDVYVCMIETFYRRFSKGWFNDIDIGLVVIDECHYDGFSKIFQFFPNQYILGLTATPVSSGNTPLNKLYNKCIIGESKSSLIEQGYLVPSIDIGHNQILDLMKQAGEYTAASQVLQFNQNHIDDKMMRLWAKHASEKQTIIFNINVEHNERVVSEFKRQGISIEGVTSKTPRREREEIEGRFERGETQILANVGIHTKGTDFPKVECIIANHSTMSLSKWFQEIGRGSRPFEGKKNFICIDLGNNLLRHGSYNDEIDWLQLFENDSLDKKTKNNKNICICPICSAYLQNRFVNNCHVCNTNLNINKPLKLESQMPEHLQGKDIKDMNFRELQEYGKFRGFKHNWAFMQRFGRFKKRHL